MLVLMLLALSSLIALPAIDRGLKDRQARQTALGLAAVARELSGRARYEGMPQQLIINVMNKSYLASRDREIQLPSDMKFGAIEGGETLEPNVHQFIFFPNGSNLGGRIDVATEPSNIAYSIRLHPLTGKVEVSRGNRQ